MNCPNCNEFMTKIQMSEDETTIWHEYCCEKCRARLKYSEPTEKSDAVKQIKSSILF